MFITELSSLFGIPNDPNGENNDCTDFPTRPCKICGRKDRPQWKGECNVGCEHEVEHLENAKQ